MTRASGPALATSDRRVVCVAVILITARRAV